MSRDERGSDEDRPGPVANPTPMTRREWRELQDLFLEARALPPDRREKLLSERRRADPTLVDRVRGLLEADSELGVLEALEPHVAPLSRVLPSAPPDRIGAYRVVSELGRGGMGVVFLAERADGQFEQRVAIKLVDSGHAGSPLYRRFLAERRILAGLDHPNIARLLDGGMTDDGRPYLVMEYVDGLPITTWCDHHRLGVRARLRVFLEVCSAVQHAHRRLVVHRDLKPGNILVSGDGRVHLLDFGIAKLMASGPEARTAPATRAGVQPMTPEYASPEQLRGQPITTASDVYSLGVLLYELLCGRSPYRRETGAAAEMVAVVCEEEPPRPSSRLVGADGGDGDRGAADLARLRATSVERLGHTLRGDLDAIVMKALRKEPDERYGSVDRFREDIERHLTDLPVAARRGTRRYRVQKLVRRRRVEATAALVTIVALIVGLGAAVRESRRANVERLRAEQALAESEAVTRFLLDLYRTDDPGDPPETELSALDLLRRGAARADRLADQPIVHARLLDAVGQLSLHLGRWNEAQRQLERAAAIRRAGPGHSSLDLAASLIHLAWVHRGRSDYVTARPLVSEALEIRRRELPPDHPDVAGALYELGWLHFGAEQERLYREALDVVGTGTPSELGVTLLQALSTNLRRQGRLPEAVATDRDALRMAELTFGAEHPATGYAMIHLADHVRDIEQDHESAERLYRSGLGLMTRTFGDNSTRLIHGLHSLAMLLGERGDPEAEALLRRALTIRQASAGPRHALVADELSLLAEELMRRDRLGEAESLARQALELTIEALGPEHVDVSDKRMPLLAEVLDAQGRFEEADDAYRTALETTPSHGVVPGQMLRGFGLMLLRRGDHAAAERHLLRSLAELEEAYGGSEHPNVQETKRALMRLYGILDKPELVERHRVPPGHFVPY